MARRRYDKTRADRFLDSLGEGVPFGLAAEAAGVGVADVRDWADRRPEFAERLANHRSHAALGLAKALNTLTVVDSGSIEKSLARVAVESELDRLRALTAG